MFLHLSVILFTGERGCYDVASFYGQHHPPGQHHPSRWTALAPLIPPLTGQHPSSQNSTTSQTAPPPWTAPPLWILPPPKIWGKVMFLHVSAILLWCNFLLWTAPPLPLDSTTPPLDSTTPNPLPVNKRTVRILLECCLVSIYGWININQIWKLFCWLYTQKSMRKATDH